MPSAVRRDCTSAGSAGSSGSSRTIRRSSCWSRFAIRSHCRGDPGAFGRTLQYRLTVADRVAGGALPQLPRPGLARINRHYGTAPSGFLVSLLSAPVVIGGQELQLQAHLTRRAGVDLRPPARRGLQGRRPLCHRPPWAKADPHQDRAGSADIDHRGVAIEADEARRPVDDAGRPGHLVHPPVGVVPCQLQPGDAGGDQAGLGLGGVVDGHIGQRHIADAASTNHARYESGPNAPKS